MTNTELIVQAFCDAGKPLTLEEVLEATTIEDEQKARGLIYYLVNKARLLKAEPTDDGISRWCDPSIDAGAVGLPSAPESSPEREVVRAQSAPRASKAPRMPDRTVASVMNLSMQEAHFPEVCLNLGTGTIVISCSNDVIRIDSLAAAQNLHAQMEQAIAALGALDAR